MEAVKNPLPVKRTKPSKHPKKQAKPPKNTAEKYEKTKPMHETPQKQRKHTSYKTRQEMGGAEHPSPIKPTKPSKHPKKHHKPPKNTAEKYKITKPMHKTPLKQRKQGGSR